MCELVRRRYANTAVLSTHELSAECLDRCCELSRRRLPPSYAREYPWAPLDRLESLDSGKSKLCLLLCDDEEPDRAKGKCV